MVFIKQLYTTCVAEAAYYVESEGEAVVIDPLRDCQQYVDLAVERKATIKYVFETHFHADFVSGHVNLSKLSNAKIVYGPTAKADFECIVATDGQEFKFGKAKITVLHTPGHTMESSCFLLTNEDGKQEAVFTGDTLFIGDVGRPDLAQKAADLTQEQLATHLYNSLRQKIMTLPDDIIVYPGHGAGSACGKNMSADTFDTLKHQKATNYALRADQTVEEFVKEVITGLSAPPIYFPLNVAMNKKEIEPMDDVLSRAAKKISVEELAALLDSKDAPLAIDTRSTKEFCAGYIPGSVFAGLDEGQFGPISATTFTDMHMGLNRPYIIIAEPGREMVSVLRLARFGFDNCIGYLEGGYQAWVAAKQESNTIEIMDPKDLHAKLMKQPDLYVIDVRRPPEFATAHYKHAVNITLDSTNFDRVDHTKEVHAYCLGGYRSVFFLSMLVSRHGFPHKVFSIDGGFKKLELTDETFADMEYKCSNAKASAEAVRKAALENKA